MNPGKSSFNNLSHPIRSVQICTLQDIYLLADLVKSRDKRREHGLSSLLVKVDDLLSSLGNTAWGKTKLLVDLGIWSGSSPRLESKVVVRKSTPTESGVCLDGKDRVTRWENAKLVLARLVVLLSAKSTHATYEDVDTRQRDDSDLEAALLQLLCRLDTEGDLGTGRNKGQVGVGNIFQNVTTLGGLLDRRSSQLRQVLSRECKDGRSVLRQDGHEISGRSLVTVGRSPEGQVGGRSQPSGSLDRLVGRSILSETDRVVSSDLDDSEVGQGRQSDGTGSVRDKVEESGTEGDQTSVGSNTVTDGSHTVLSDTESEVSSSVATETSGRVLEILGTLPSSQVGTGQIGRSTNELGENSGELGNGRLGELSRSDGGVLGGVSGESLLPTLGKSSLDSSSELGSLLGVLLLVLGEQLVPSGLLLGTLLSDLVVEVVGLLGNGKGLLWVEAELLLELGDVVLLESWMSVTVFSTSLTSTVDIVSTSTSRTETDGGLEVDNGRSVGALLGLGNSGLDRIKVAKALANAKC